jgi:hypothetical protein
VNFSFHSQGSSNQIPDALLKSILTKILTQILNLGYKFYKDFPQEFARILLQPEFP